MIIKNKIILTKRLALHLFQNGRAFHRVVQRGSWFNFQSFSHYYFYYESFSICYLMRYPKLLYWCDILSVFISQLWGFSLQMQLNSLFLRLLHQNEFWLSLHELSSAFIIQVNLSLFKAQRFSTLKNYLALCFRHEQIINLNDCLFLFLIQAFESFI